jgi:general secretion pathway protein D
MITVKRKDKQAMRLLSVAASDAKLRIPYTEATLRRIFAPIFLLTIVLFMAGCPSSKSNQNFNQGMKAEQMHDYDTALAYYQKALALHPSDAEYQIRVGQLKFEASQYHLEQGNKFLANGNLTMALAEFQKTKSVDPSNEAADQQIQRTLNLIAVQQGAPAPSTAAPGPDADLLNLPPQLKPLSIEPINLKMTNDARVVFETVGKLAGLSVIFDPDFAQNSKKITVELPNVTLEQALDAVSLEAKAFWKPVTSGIILVAPDQPQKRRDLDDEVVRTFYLSNTLTSQDITEIVTGLRQLLDLKRLQQVNAQNAIVIRDTPDKLMLAARIIDNIDKARPEVLIQVDVLEARLDNMNQLGILPGQSVALAFTPRTSVQPNGGTSSTTSSTSTTTTSSTANQITLNNLAHLSSADYSITLPGAEATALLTDTGTKIIEDPEVRVSDGQQAKLRIGDKVPIATGSFQAGVGVATTGVNPLVNTQFQYQDVGVNIDVTPRVHPDNEISLKLKIEVSSVTGQSNLGGIEQPIISQRTVEHEVRLREGESSILGGLMSHTVNKSLNGWPGFANIPIFNYLFAQHMDEVQDDDVLIVITPRIIRMPAITAENLASIATGTDTNVRIYREQFENPASPATPAGATGAPAAAPVIPSGSFAQPRPTTPGVNTIPSQPGLAPPSAAAGSQSPSMALQFQPANMNMHPGDTATIGLEVQNVQDLFSIPLLVQYNPAVIQIDDVRNGGFLSGGTQDIAIVHNVDQQHGQAIISATRQPGTPGVSGSGTLLGLVIRAVAPGNSSVQIVQVNARDSQQRDLPLSAGTATVLVK